MSLDGNLIGVDFAGYQEEYADIVEAVLSVLRDEESIDTKNFKLGLLNGNEYCQQIGRYSMVQLFRSYAAHIVVHGSPPRPTNDRPIISPELNQMYNGEITFGQFPHLIDHSDADGFYFPIDFKAPILLEAPNGEQTWQVGVGSSQALLRELNELNKHLKMTVDYGEAGGYEELLSLIDNDEYEAEKYVWAMMRWLARESVDRNLLFEFC